MTSSCILTVVHKQVSVVFFFFLVYIFSFNCMNSTRETKKTPERMSFVSHFTHYKRKTKISFHYSHSLPKQTWKVLPFLRQPLILLNVCFSFQGEACNFYAISHHCKNIDRKQSPVCHWSDEVMVPPRIHVIGRADVAVSGWWAAQTNRAKFEKRRAFTRFQAKSTYEWLSIIISAYEAGENSTSGKITHVTFTFKMRAAGQNRT